MIQSPHDISALAPIKAEELVDIPSYRWDKYPPVCDHEEESEVVEQIPEKDKTLHIEDKIYKAFVQPVWDKIDDNYDNYLSGLELEVIDKDNTYNLFLSAILYRDDENYVTDIIPIWCELHSYVGEDMIEYINDFSFKKLKQYLL